MGEVLMQEDTHEKVKVTDNALWIRLYGETSTGTKIPLKVVDDGSGLGKIPFSYE